LIKRKSLIVLSMSSFLVLAACGGNAKESGNSGEKAKDEVVQLTWYLHAQYGKEYFENDVIKPFQEKYPNIKIKATYTNDPEQQQKAELAAGAGPDILTSDGATTIREFAKVGYALPLDEYGKKYEWDKRFIPWAYNPMTVDGKLIGVPGKYETEVVYYNKKLFADNGWETPKSYQELLALSEAIAAKGLIPFAFGASDFRPANEWWYSLAFNATLGPDKVKQLLTGEIPWNGAESKQAVEKLVELWQKGFINDKQSQAITGDDATNLFLNGKAAMKMEGTWLLGTLTAKGADMDWGVFPMPSWTDGVETNLPLALGAAYGVNGNSKHPDEAALFLDYLVQPETAKKAVVGSGFQPINGVDLNSIENIDKHYIEVAELMDDYSQRKATGYLSWTFWPPQTRVYTYDNIEAVFLKGLKLDAFLDGIEAAFQKDKEAGKLFEFAE